MVNENGAARHCVASPTRLRLRRGSGPPSDSGLLPVPSPRGSGERVRERGLRFSCGVPSPPRLFEHGTTAFRIDGLHSRGPSPPPSPRFAGRGRKRKTWRREKRCSGAPFWRGSGPSSDSGPPPHSGPPSGPFAPRERGGQGEGPHFTRSGPAWEAMYSTHLRAWSSFGACIRKAARMANYSRSSGGSGPASLCPTSRRSEVAGYAIPIECQGVASPSS